MPASLAIPWRDGVAAGDHDSVGVFQQRAGWGSVYNRMRATGSAQRFFLGGDAGQRGLLDIPGWADLEIGEACQRVQVSAFPTRYASRVDEAAALLRVAAGR